MQSIQHYNSVAKWLHWSIAILMTSLVLSGAIITNFKLPESIYLTSIQFHKFFGFCVLGLALFRVYWSIEKRAPAYPETVRIWQKVIAKIVHFAMYAFMLIIPLAGWAYVSASSNDSPVKNSFFPTPDLPVEQSESAANNFLSIHEAGAWTFFLVLIAHVGAAAFHHYIQKDSIFLRMLPLKEGATGKIAIPIILGLAALFFAGLFTIPALAGE
jgi:cytochrome b561